MSSNSTFGRMSPANPLPKPWVKPVEGEIVAVKTRKKKNKKPQQAALPRQDEEPLDRSGIATDGPSFTSPPARTLSDGPGMEETRQWGQSSGPRDDELDSPFAVGDEEEFRNVWDGGEPSSKPARDQ
jgi:hypothetical protein